MRFVALVTLLACTSSAAAQVATSPRAVQVVVSGGLQLPMGGFADAHDLGYHADASVIFRAFGNLRLRPELTYARFQVKEVLTGALAQRLAAGGLGGAARDVYTDAASSLMGGLANIEVPLGSGGFQPFILAGVGAVNFKTDVGSTSEALSETKMSLNVGAGVRFRLGGIGGLIEARLNDVPSDGAKAYFKSVRTIPVTFGLVF